MLQELFGVKQSEWNKRGIRQFWPDVKWFCSGRHDPMLWGMRVMSHLLKSRTPSIRSSSNIVLSQEVKELFGKVKSVVEYRRVHITVLDKAAHAFHIFAPLFRFIDEVQHHAFYQFLMCNEDTDFVKFHAAISRYAADRLFVVVLPEFLSPSQSQYFRAFLRSRFSPIPTPSDRKLLIITSAEDLGWDSSRLNTALVRQIRKETDGYFPQLLKKFFLVHARLTGSRKSTYIK
jgi:hypothetical protein